MNEKKQGKESIFSILNKKLQKIISPPKKSKWSPENNPAAGPRDEQNIWHASMLALRQAEAGSTTSAAALAELTTFSEKDRSTIDKEYSYRVSGKEEKFISAQLLRTKSTAAIKAYAKGDIDQLQKAHDDIEGTLNLVPRSDPSVVGAYQEFYEKCNLLRQQLGKALVATQTLLTELKQTFTETSSSRLGPR